MHRSLYILASIVALSACGQAHAIDWFLPPDDCFLTSDQKLLAPLQNQEVCNDFTVSTGGALRFRYIDERNRLRPPLQAGSSNYDQWRLTPFLEMKYSDLITGYVQAIDAASFGNELPEVGIDENRSDLLQYYVDLNLLDSDDGSSLHFRYGRQFLQYGSQHLISPLGWANTFRNFEGYRLYYSSNDWAIDGFAVQPVNAAANNIYRPRSRDIADQSRWFSGVYTTYKNAPGGTFDIYWLWLKEQEDRLDFIDGDRHTFGFRYAGKKPCLDEDDKAYLTFLWDFETATQFGEEDLATGLDQEISAGMVSLISGFKLDQATWSPTLQGILYWGSGDRDPNDGKSQTFNTLFPLGHAYWGQIDNFAGENLIDYGVHLTVEPTDKFNFLAGWHWFEKAAREDAIYNIAGVPFGGFVPSESQLGNELDLVGTYQVNENLQLQAGYFWFWYGAAVSENPNPLVANRGDAKMFYVFADWAF
jgi:hypothetical protein